MILFYYSYHFYFYYYCHYYYYYYYYYYFLHTLTVMSMKWSHTRMMHSLLLDFYISNPCIWRRNRRSVQITHLHWRFSRIQKLEHQREMMYLYLHLYISLNQEFSFVVGCFCFNSFLDHFLFARPYLGAKRPKWRFLVTLKYREIVGFFHSYTVF